ncbi:hypothetical protein HDU91_003077 [Kappamyces sp. JEL0680]|nr:hypothetical protein HDU91_003077 [Kappamyces sp. JEL0680]
MPTKNAILGIETFDQAELDAIKYRAIKVAESTNPLETGIYRSALAPKELLKDFPTIKTVYDMFNNSVKHHGDRQCLGTRYPSYDAKGGIQWSDYQWKTYKQVNEDRLAFGAGLMSVYDKHVAEKTSNWFLGIFSVNRYEWVISDFGAGCYSIPNVALYDTLGPETSEFIINHSEIPIIVTSVDKVATLLQLSAKCPTLKVIIVMESLFKQQESPIPILQKWGAQLGVQVIPFSQVLELGKKNPRPHRPPVSGDMYALSYTSGRISGSS